MADAKVHRQAVSGETVLLWPVTQYVYNPNTLSFEPLANSAGTGQDVSVLNFPATQQVSAASLPLPSGASTESTLAAIKAKTDNLDVLLSTRTKPADVQSVSGPVTDAQLRAAAVPVAELPDDTAVYSPSASDSVAYEASRVVKGSAGTLYSITGHNSLAADQFIQVHNTTSLPADGAVPVVIFLAVAGRSFSYSADKFGKFFSTGITVCNSSTGPTKSIGAANCWFNVAFK